MSNSRRGLLAAGLAAAVVGATGVVWTLNANAAETPAAPAAQPVTETTAADDAVPVPPALLPWGEEPHDITRGSAGASSSAVAAAGADAAPADTSGATEPVAEYGPKGRSSRNGTLTRDHTDIVPPTPPGTDKGGKKVTGDVYFNYAVGSQTGDTDGTWANLTIAKPELAQGDYHSLTEVTVQTVDGRQIVELGWTVDRSVNGDDDPHMFVYYWKDKVPTCYNACGYKQFSPNVKPGDTLPVGVQKRFGIQHTDDKWWIAYDSEYIGYFPDSLWNGTYTRGGLSQWFGEVASPSESSCTDMGNGEPASEGNAARVGSISMTNGPEPKATVRASNSALYSIDLRSDRTFRYGGQGSGDCTPPA
ncbi:neprosin family prolyl endopeptidase [Actinoplanes sp. N902-109]|uniref:neprosin family prolyl endopeptidase n=1 Tax=Actinoplanes sp. (strain N902-109) TaxID=649831 RepID=UPI0003295FB9|nr:neprosin family prolyl endopeptidase [Actinoplanes sp. N902-109]AGL14080.1 hypothetical protein L083_0570 [Actinoplanes sp. N902-109]